MASFKDMTKSGEMKRADAYKVQLEDIHIEPGFNLRDKAIKDSNGLTFDESVQALADFIYAGGKVPALEVRPRDEGGVWLVDGERRTRAYRLLDEAGKLPRTPNKEDPAKLEAWILVTQFEGNDAERTARVLTSADRRDLMPLERGRGYQRLAAFGWEVLQIATKVGRTVQHVKDCLDLVNSNTDVQKLVQEKAVSASVAVATVRQHGEKAGQVLAKVAAENGGKVKPRNLKPKTVPVALYERLEFAVKDLMQLYEGSAPHEALDAVTYALRAIEKVREQ